MFYEEYSKIIKHKAVIYKMTKVLYKRSCNSCKWSNFIFLLFPPLGTYCKWKRAPRDSLLNRVWVPLSESNEPARRTSGVADSARHLTSLVYLVSLCKILFNLFIASLDLASNFSWGGITQNKHSLTLSLTEIFLAFCHNSWKILVLAIGIQVFWQHVHFIHADS